MEYNRSVIPFSSPDFKIADMQFRKLIRLKEGLYIDDETEINEDKLFDLVCRTTIEDFLLLRSVINILKNAPEKIKSQYFKIINAYSCEAMYESIIAETEELFFNDADFNSFLLYIKKELSLTDELDYKIINSYIYELAHNYMNDYVNLFSRKVYLNFHFLYKWMLETRLNVVPCLSELENMILVMLADGGWTTNHINSEILNCNEDDAFIQSLMYQILPAKFNMESITQVMAFLYFQNPKIVEILKTDSMFNEIKK